jgi:hypothetical protein
MQNFHFAITSPQIINRQVGVIRYQLIKLFFGRGIRRDRGGLAGHLINRHNDINTANAITADIFASGLTRRHFFADVFFTAAFFTGDFFTVAFLAGDFFTAALLAVFLATGFLVAAFFADAFFAAAFFTGSLAISVLQDTHQ